MLFGICILFVQDAVNGEKNLEIQKKQGDTCLWEDAWSKKNYDFSRDFGILNWIRYYFGFDTSLEKYMK